MPPEVACPACQHRLPAACGPACPRCGAALAGPGARPAAGDVPVAPGPLPTIRCPACGKAVLELCLTCPHCEGPLAEHHHTPAEGQEEGRAPSEGRLFLAVLGGVALALGLGAVFEVLARRGGFGFRAVVLLVLASLQAYLLAALCVAVKVAPRRDGRWARLLVDGLAGLGCLGLALAAVLLVLPFIWPAAR
jgi:hypothetical protein